MEKHSFLPVAVSKHGQTSNRDSDSFQVVPDMRNNCWQGSRGRSFCLSRITFPHCANICFSGSAAEKGQTFHRANRWVTFDMRKLLEGQTEEAPSGLSTAANGRSAN